MRHPSEVIAYEMSDPNGSKVWPSNTGNIFVQLNKLKSVACPYYHRGFYINLVNRVHVCTKLIYQCHPPIFLTAETKCEKLRNEANNGMLGRHVPQCKADGSFEPRQCDGSTGYCACVDKNGSEVPGTQTPPGGREPNCRALGTHLN